MNPTLFHRSPCWRALIPALALAVAPAARALIIGPYTPDANTLHLWHFNESAVPVVDSASTGGTNLNVLGGGATLNNASFAGFGTALSTLDGGQANTNTAARDAYLSCLTLVNSTADNVSTTLADPTTGAFTIEAIVYIGFDPAMNLGTVANGGNGRSTQCQIIAGEDEANAGRLFQFRIDPIGTASPLNLSEPMLEFINLRQAAAGQVQNMLVPIPTSGENAIASNYWYHVAVVYNGNQATTDNLKFYWTLMDASRVLANQIGTATMANDMSVATTDLAIGNIGRNPSQNAFLGMIDEVRISKTARSAGQLMFADPSVFVIEGPTPTNQVVGIGQAANWSISVGGLNPTYQWRHAGTNLAGATGSAYGIAAAGLADAGEFDVVVTNSTSALTSSVANLTVRLGTNLVWTPASSDWDTVTMNWDSSADNAADSLFASGDSVRFDNNGLGAAVVNLAEVVAPESVVVDADGDYTFTTFGAGYIGSNAKLTKAGLGKLTVDVDSLNTGATVIGNGYIEVGFGASRGLLGTGPVTNHTGLVFNRLGGYSITTLAGAGGLTNNAAGVLTLAGTNDFHGPVVINSGGVAITGQAALSGVTNFLLTASANGTGGSRVTLAGGVVVPANVTASLLGSSVAPDNRCNLTTTAGTNVWNGPLVYDGSGANSLITDGGEFDVNGPITGPNFSGKVILRGGGVGYLNSVVNLPGGHVSKTDGSVWVITSTGNIWTNTDVASGTLRLGANNVLPSGITVNMTGGSLDLAGFNQTIAVLNGTSGPIGNSSTNADSTLTVLGNTNYSGTIQNVISNGTHKVALIVVGGPVTLSGSNTYSGDTTVSSGTLALTGGGSLTGTSNINVAAGATLDVSARASGGYAVGASQTLKGNGAFNVIGNLTNSGTIELKLSKSGATLANDSLNGLTSLTYGGTLKLDVTASPALAVSDSFKLFNAAAYAGSFAAFVPATPAPGLAWDASTLATDGTLRLKTGMATNPTNIVFATAGGGQLDLSWPEDHKGWVLQSNSVSIVEANAWHPVAGSETNTHVLLNIDPAQPGVFFRLILP